MEAEVKMYTPGPGKSWLVKAVCNAGSRKWISKWQVTPEGEITMLSSPMPRPAFNASREAVHKWYDKRKADQARAVPFSLGDSQD